LQTQERTQIKVEEMTMSKVVSRIFILTLLIFTSSLQGWPLLITATCNMAEPQMMSQGEDCCCCKNSQSSQSPAFAACNPGKSLVGILATDSSLLPCKDKTDKSLLQPLTVAPATNLPSPFSLAILGFCTDELILPHIIAAPLYLFDCTFRL
jgi:hypothetical protein